jgi:hypothetical protein
MLKNALRATALLSLLAAGAFLSSTPIKAAGKPKGAAARRTTWLYNKGSFRMTGKETWVEQNGKNSSGITYREVKRTTHYVTLYDKQRKKHVRLYDTTVYYFSRARQKWALLYQGRWTDPYKVPLDQDRFPDERGRLAAATERKAFPHLGREFQVLGPATMNYNCIAWAVGVTNQWVWPIKPGKEPSVADFDVLFGKHGYRRVKGLNFDLKTGTQKIVLYGKRKGQTWEPTHVARQLFDGSWSSKLGNLPLVRHLEPSDLDGGVYGVPIAVYVRSRTKNVAQR